MMVGNFLISDERVSKTGRYKKDKPSQVLLQKLNKQLQPLELEAVSNIGDFSKVPVLFISYLPRSGSTLLYQLLALTRRFNYISNLQSRFWLAPYLGGHVEISLYDKFKAPLSLRSDYGLTSEPFEPSEFTYFWEHWLNIARSNTHTLTKREEKRIKTAQLVIELNALRSLSSFPLVFKKEWLGMNAGFLIENIPNVKFVHIDRSSLDLTASILHAREDVYGSIHSWWAAKPSNYAQLSRLDPCRQVAGQISGIRNDISKWVSCYPDKFLCLRYEYLLQDVRRHIKMIADFSGVKLRDSDLTMLPQSIKRKTAKPLKRWGKQNILQALKEFGLNG